jgi:serine/threonine protein kinase
MTFQDGHGRRDEGLDTPPGDRTGGATYRELLPIGSGGSANISIAVAEGIAGFSKLVVLKTIREELTSNSAATKMFLDEARLSARMNHPNVVQVYEVFLRRDVPVIVMEFLDGQPLNMVLAQAPDSKSLTVELAISILSKVLAGLHYAHTLRDFSGEPLGLIHRDVSPHNVMVTYDGQVKLVDFGIAKLASVDHHTRTGVIKGKLTYMAPEQFTGKVDCRADIFSVGVMLWELATRQRFWGELAEPALIGRLISGDLPHLRKPSDIDDELYRICCKALAHHPDDRYATAADMQEDLDRFLARRGAVVTQVAIGQLVTDTCAEARRKVQAGIREQLSEHGLSITGSVDGLAAHERLRPKPAQRETASRERLRPRPGDASTGGLRSKKAGDYTTTGGLRSKAGATTGVARSKTAADYTTTGGLRAKPGTDTAHFRSKKPGDTTSGGLGPKAANDRTLASLPTESVGSEPPPAASVGVERNEPVLTADAAGAAPEGTPLRLFGGVAPTARAGVALAGFGTLAVLILALGLATPGQKNGTAAEVDNGAAPAQAAQPPRQETPPPRSLVRISVSAQPPITTWFLDDEKLDSNPVEISVPKDGVTHTLRAEAPGYTTFVKSIRFEGDVDITVALARK